MTWWQIAGAVLVGFGAGVLSGMFGVGGAVVSTPGLRVLGATPIEAVGSTVPAILPGAVSGTVRYARAGVVNWRVGLVCGGTGAALAVAGAAVAEQVNAHLLMVATAALLGWSGVATYRSGRARPEPAIVAELAEQAEESVVAPPGSVAGEGPAAAVVDRATTRAAVPVVALVAVGAGAGFVAGLLGVGGGVVMMPVFTSLLRIPIKEAVASSLVAVALFSLPALVAHAALGNIHWGFALLLVVGSVPGAQVGSRLTLGASDHTVRVAFGLFLVVLAVVYGVSELLAL
jgi:uncharacterized membrane protein YfcA